jgi:DNA modification methylase
MMMIKKVPIGKICPALYNPRQDLRQGDPEYEKLKRSLNEFGCVEPLVWNKRTGNLVGGHQRLKVLIDQGATEVDVSVVDLPLEKEKALNIALNKISGDWDQNKLASLLDELTKVPNFDIGITGFDLPDVEELLSSILAESQGGKDENFDVEKELQKEGPAITQPGDLIQLGQHRLLCGDSSKASSYTKLLDKEAASLLFTDPPYNVDYKTPAKGSRWRAIAGDRVNVKEYSRWLTQVLKQAAGSLSPGSAAYIWNGHKNFSLMHQCLENEGFKVSAVITWAKESFALGRGDYKQQTEFCLYAWKQGNGAHRWYGPTNETTLWQIRREPTKSYQHPTQKPLELAERALRNSTRAGELVLDPFLGSGTTLIASERTGRKCYGIELDPLYCDVIVRRYIAFAGEKTVSPDLVNRYRQAQLEVAA